MGKFRGLDTDEGWIMRKLTELDRRLTELAAARRLGLLSEVYQVSVNAPGLGEGFTDFGTLEVVPPVGYNLALVQMMATAGVSYPNEVGGSVGVQARAGAFFGPGQSSSRPGNSLGGGPAVAVADGLAARFPVVAGVPFTLRAAAYANAGYDSGSDNVRFSAMVLYTRE